MIAQNYEKWRVCGGCCCYVLRNKDIILAAPDKKKSSDSMVKLIKKEEKDFISLWIDQEDEFELSFNEHSPSFLIRHPQFPEPEKWYNLRNWLLETNDSRKYTQIMNFLNYIDSSKGVLDEKFTPVFSDELSRSVDFTSPKLPGYDDILDEAERRINIDFGKKTKKWIPGHKYDTLETSYYYVQEAWSRIINRGAAGGKESYKFLKEDIDKVKENAIYLTLIKAPKDKTNPWNEVVVSGRDIGKEYNYLNYINKKISAVDCGEFVSTVPLIPDPKNWRIDLIQRTIKDCCTEEKEIIPGVVTKSYRKINLLLEPLYLYLGEKDEEDLAEVGKYILPIIEPVVRDCIKEIILHSFSTMDMKDGSIEIVEKNIQTIFTRFTTGYIRDSFYNKQQMIKGLFNALGLSLDQVIKEELETFNWTTIHSTWDGYVKNSEIIPGRDKILNLKPSSVPNYYGAPEEISLKKIHDVISDNTLRELIIDTIKNSLDNYKLGLDEFKVSTHQYQRKEIEYYEIKVSVGNIIKYLKDVKNRELTEEEKRSIMGSSFWNFYLTCPTSIVWDDEY